MNKWSIIYLLLFTSCVDFEFEAPYEDLNGIYLEHVLDRDDIYGRKLLCEEHRTYISSGGLLTSYSFAQVDSIYELSTYASDYIYDFDIADGIAYITSISGLEIVDFPETEPHLIGFYDMYGGHKRVRVNDDNAYVTLDKFYIIDVSDKVHPGIIGEFDFGYAYTDIIWFEVGSSLAYILFNNNNFCILDVSDPTNINMVSQVSVMDRFTGSANMFAKKGDYLYFLKTLSIETYQLSENYELEYLSSTGLAGFPMQFIYVGEKYGLVCPGISWVYLLTLEYPSRPLVTEMYELDNYQDFGIIRDNYIYLLDPYLEILEIKEIQ